MISFGPVPSRRLGKSLGINNIISPKTCSYSCIYCQVGKTIKLLKKTGVPVAVISNASMLFYESVRRDLCMSDWVSLKMDAGDIITWYLINRRVGGLGFYETMED